MREKEVSPALSHTIKNLKKAKFGIVASDPPQYTEQNLAKAASRIRSTTLGLFSYLCYPFFLTLGKLINLSFLSFSNCAMTLYLL